MKTKKSLLAGALLMFGLISVNSVKAEVLPYGTSATITDPVTINLVFKPIQSIQVNPDQKVINFEYDSPTDYSAGTVDNKTVTKDDHLTVYHSGPFAVSVTSSGFMNGETPLAGDHVKIIAGKGSTIPAERNNFNFINKPSLSAGTKEFFSSEGGGMGLTFNVTYEHDGWKSEDTYVNMANGTEATTYTATVTYTIASK